MKRSAIALTLMLLIGSTGISLAATISAGTTAPTTDGSDISMLNLSGASGQGKFWAGEGFAAGQTFTTASDSVGYRLNSVLKGSKLFLKLLSNILPVII